MKTAIITGAFSDIGLEICDALGSQGYKLICQYSSKENSVLLKSKGFDVISVRANFSTHKGILKFIDYLEKKTDSVDILVHCAAQVEKRMKNIPEASVFSIISNVNLYAPILITKKMVIKMKQSENPNILFLSSTYAKRLGSLKSIYYASTKSALIAVSRIFAQEFVGIRSNVIIPGYVDTKTYRLERDVSRIKKDKKLALTKKLVSPKEISDTVDFIIKNKALNGAVIEVDGGLCL